jgi:hypothetical protein
MDEHRVDAVTRAIAQGASRRTVLRALFGATALATAGKALPASAKSEKITLCKPTDSGYKLTDVNVKQVDKRLQDGYFEPPFSCDEQPSCEPCQGTCVEWDEPCSADADCCSERCLDAGTCGGTCYCYDLYDSSEDPSGQICLSGSGWGCSISCTSSADCAYDEVCIWSPADDTNCPNVGVCATTMYGPCDY